MGSPDTPQQTVHTIESPPNSGNNFILAFESGADCMAFASALQDLEFVNPRPEETVFEPFSEYCEASGLSMMVVPEDFELNPPQINTGDYHEDDALEDDDAIIGPNIIAENDELDAWS